jgi:hypothetical protein
MTVKQVVSSSTLLVSMLMAGGSVLADTAGDNPRLTRERLFADAQVEVERIGQKFANKGEETQLRHRVNEQAQTKAEKARHQHQYRTKHSHQYAGASQQNRHSTMPSGSMAGRRSGGGGRR